MKRQAPQKRSKVEYRQQSRSLDYAEATDGNPLGLQNLPAPPQLKPWRWFGLFGFVLMSMAIFATAIVFTIAKDKKSTLLQAEEKRLRESVVGRVKILETWLEGQHMAGRRLTDSRVFRLFVTDLGLQTPTSPLPRSLQDQRPYFLQLMTDFARQNDLARATVLKEDGTVLLSSPGPALAVADLLQELEGATSGWDFLPSSIRRIGGQNGQFVVDIMMAFPEAQAEDEGTRSSSTVLVLTVPIERVLGSVLSNELASTDHEEISLFQRRGEDIEHFLMIPEGIDRSKGPISDTLRLGMPIAFGLQGDGRPAYVFGEPIQGVEWSLVHTLDAKIALSPVHDFIKVASGLSTMTVLALTAAFSAFWWRRDRNHHRLIANLHKAHAGKIDRQHQFLQSVTTSISDWLTVSSPDGQLIYANPAFEAAAKPSEGPITDKKWEDLVNVLPNIGQNQDCLVHLIDGGQFDLVEIGGSQRVISTHISDLGDENGGVRGTIRVVRDHTELVAERQRRLLSVTQTIDAFIHAIELRDPFLLGHTERVRTHAIAMGRRLGLSSNELAGLALAASLSQVGKIFVPDHILAKPERHNTEEKAIMRNHCLHAVDILGRIDFDLPVADIVAQMHERLDGSGYPHGLIGDQIGLCGRILGVADLFCARTAPRSYRDRISAGKTLYHLASNDQRYDLKVVAALAEIVGHGHEIDGTDIVEQTFIDADVWKEKRRRSDLVSEPA